MAGRILGLTLLWTISLTLSLSAGEHVNGVVRSISGEPLADALVCSSSWWCTKTTREGRYSLEIQSGFRGLLRISLDGCKPALVSISGADIDVVLDKAMPEQISWTVPTCPLERRKHGKYYGGRLKVFVPADAKVVQGNDVDYWSLSVGYGPDDMRREWLRIGGGPTWSSGFPSKADLEGLTDVVDRNLVITTQSHLMSEVPFLDGIDVRGRTKTGAYYRHTGNAFETIGYRVMTKNAADYFDRIIDSLCSDLPKTLPLPGVKTVHD